MEDPEAFWTGLVERVFDSHLLNILSTGVVLYGHYTLSALPAGEPLAEDPEDRMPQMCHLWHVGLDREHAYGKQRHQMPQPQLQLPCSA